MNEVVTERDNCRVAKIQQGSACNNENQDLQDIIKRSQGKGVFNMVCF